MDKEKIAVLKAQIDSQIGEIENIYAKIEERKRIEGITAVESISYQLHNLYSAFEDLFKITAKAFENHINDINRYHTELLKRMTMHIEGVRPSLISKESYMLLDSLRSFRHFFRHAYGYELDERKVDIVLEDAARLKKIYKKDIKRFLNKLSYEVMEQSKK